VSDDAEGPGAMPDHDASTHDLGPGYHMAGDRLGALIEHEEASRFAEQEVEDSGLPPALLQENLERRAGDRRLVEQLARDGFAGRRYELFENELAKYGVSVLRGWMATGTIFQRVARLGYRLHPTGRELEELYRDSEVRDELATMTVALALPRFREQALVGKGWRYEGGASITTYFMGATLYAFPNEFRKWRNQREGWRRQDYGDYTANGLRHQVANDDTDTLVLGDLRVAQDLARLKPRCRDIVMLTLQCYSQDEIAEILGISVRAVEGVLHRWRTHERKLLKEESGGPGKGGAAE